MAYDKVVDSAALNADLTTVANAIRTASGATENLVFPSGYVSALQNMKMVAEVHTVTLASDVVGIGSKTLLSGNAFIKKYYNNEKFAAVLIADTVPNTTGAVSFVYHGNKDVGQGYEGISFRFTSASAVGMQPLNQKISGEGYSNHLRVNSSGNLMQYLGSDAYKLNAGTYTIVLICAEE